MSRISGGRVGGLDHHRRSLKSLRGSTPVLSCCTAFDKQVGEVTLSEPQ